MLHLKIIFFFIRLTLFVINHETNPGIYLAVQRQSTQSKIENIHML